MGRKLFYLITCVSLLVVNGATQAGVMKWETVVQDANPIHWYRFDEAPGTTAADDEGSADLDGEYRELVDLGQEGLFGPGQAVLFERGGQTDVMWTQGGDLTSEEWTAEFIVMKMSNTVAQAISDSADFSLRIVGWGVDEELSFTEYGVIDARFTAVAGADLVAPVEQWIHVVYRKSGGETQVFVDGVLTGTTSTLADCPIDSFGGRAGGDSDGMDGFMDEAVIYDYALTDADILAHATAPFVPDVGAIVLLPENGAADVPRDTSLSWMAGTYAETHDIYLGTVLENVSTADRANPLDVLVSQGQTESTYDPTGNLQFGQTYYWRVDEVNAAPDNTIFKGDVWSFTVEPLAYPIEGATATSNGSSEMGVGPENTINGSGLNADDQHSDESDDMWLARPVDNDLLQIEYAFDRVYKLHEMLVWNYNVQFELMLGFGLKNVTVEYSEDGVNWMSLGDVELAQATAKSDYTANTAVDLAGVAAQYVRLTVNSGFGMMGQYGLSEVRFTYVPVHAGEPQPADEAADVSVEAALSWRAGREATVHEVYLDTDEQAVADGTALVDTVTESSYGSAELQFGATYFWKINEVNEAEAIASWEGDLWSFSTEEFALVEDFESYNDEDNVIYETWIDGWVNETGSTVGYLQAPFAEQTIVNSGGQSMPLQYDNSASPFYSEAERNLGSQNWASNGADTLVVNFQGNAPEFAETDDGRILMNSIGADVWGTADQFRYAYKRLSGNGSIVARVDYLMNTWGWAKAGVMIREGLDAGSTHAMTVVSPANGVALQYRPVMNQASFGINEMGPVAPYWVKLTRSGNSFTAERSEDGINWVSITADPAASTVEIEMDADVYIGLMACSTRADIVGAATFSNIATTGNVTGVWETSGVGVDQPAGNTPETLYVAIEDSAGNVQVVNHPDELATAVAEWQAWQIPFSELSGVNLGSVRTIYIGIGDRDNPTTGGTGTIYIDDIGFGHPASGQ
jgi:Concanavalin A-like lectin/glucanases superfamily